MPKGNDEKKAPRTSMVFRDEQQRKDFDIACANAGIKQMDIVQAMIDEFTGGEKGFLAIVNRVKRNKK